MTCASPMLLSGRTWRRRFSKGSRPTTVPWNAAPLRPVPSRRVTVTRRRRVQQLLHPATCGRRSRITLMSFPKKLDSSFAGQPIGVFDSGIGGLTVVRALRELLPEEDIFYLGDTARLPYGGKDRTTIERYSLEIAGLL